MTAFQWANGLLPVCLGVAWLASAAWVRDDARRRIRNDRAVLLATASAVVVPFMGAVAWALVRPAETLEERRYRRLVRLLAELEAGPEPADGEVAPSPKQALRRPRVAVVR